MHVGRPASPVVAAGETIHILGRGEHRAMARAHAAYDSLHHERSKIANVYFDGQCHGSIAGFFFYDGRSNTPAWRIGSPRMGAFPCPHLAHQLPQPDRPGRASAVAS